MNFLLFSEGIIELVFSFFTCFFVFFMGFKVFSLVTRDIDELSEIKDNNIAVAILGFTFIFGIMLIIKSAISPAMDILSMIFQSGNFTITNLLFTALRIIILYIVSAIFAFLILWISIKLFLILTSDIDEMEEIKNNNISISIVIGTLIISMDLIVSTPLTTLLNGLIVIPATNDSGIQEHLINMSVFLQGIIEVGLSIIGGIFIFFFSFKIFSLLTREINEISEMKKNNIAVGILLSSFIFSVMIMVKAALEPANSALGFALSSENTGYLVILFAVIRIIVFFLISAILSFLLIWGTLISFMLLTRNINEMNEIKKNNIAVAILVGILLISASLLLEHGLTVMLSGLIKTPVLGKGILDITNIK